MKRTVLSLAVLFVTMALSAQVNSTLVKLVPETLTEGSGSPEATFEGGFKITRSGNGINTNPAGYMSKDDTITVKETTLKLSKDYEHKILIPTEKVVVRIDFLGYSNSNEAMNWDYLAYLYNGGADFTIFKEKEDYAGAAPASTFNTEIQALTYPISPLSKDYGVFASFGADKFFPDGAGWYDELNFYIDGNNGAAINVHLYVVDAEDIANYDPDKDETINNPSSTKNVILNTDENAPAYNLLGQPVSDDYKGIVIKNGKKYLVK